MKIHMVKKGETLYQLSQKYQVDLNKLIEINPQIENPDVLDVGMKVKVPSTPSQVAYSNIPKSIDKLEQTKIKPSEPVQEAEPIAKESKPPEVTMKAKETKLPEAAKKAKETKQTTMPADPPGKWADPIPSKNTEDLFQQYKVPAEKVGSFYDIPEIPDMKEFMQPPQQYAPSGSMQPPQQYAPTGYMQAHPYSQPDCGCMPMQDMMPFNNMMGPEGYAQPSYNLPYGSMPNATLPYGMSNNPSASYGMEAEIPCDFPVYPGINNNQHHSMHMNPHAYGMPHYMHPNPMMAYGQMTPPNWNFTGRTASADMDQTEENTSDTSEENEPLNFSDSKNRPAKAAIRSKKASKGKPERKTKKNLKKIAGERESIPWINH